MSHPLEAEPVELTDEDAVLLVPDHCAPEQVQLLDTPRHQLYPVQRTQHQHKVQQMGLGG